MGDMREFGWLTGTLAVATLAAAAYSVCRIVVGALRGRCAHGDVDVTHALMGISMAGMFVTDLRFFSVGIWQTTFAAVIAWYAIRSISGSENRNSRQRGLLRQTGHLLSVAAMLYMLHTAPSAASRASNAPGIPMDMAMSPAPGVRGHPQTLSLLIAALLVGYAVMVVDQIGQGVQAHAASGTDGPPLAPRAAVACEVVMCAAMAISLITGT